MFSDAQVVSAGGTRRMTRRRVANGAWLRLAHNVLALPGNPPTWHRQAMAATLAVQRSAVDRRAAAHLHSYPRMRAGRIELVAPPSQNPSTSLAVVRRSNTVETCFVGPIRVVTRADTILRLAAELTGAELSTLVREAAVVHRSLVDELADRHAALCRSRLPGIASVRAILAELASVDEPDDSVLEVALDRVLARVRELPPVVRQATPPWLERARGRVDRWVPAWRLVVEADGRRWHTRVDDFEHDRWRDNEAAAHGHHVLRFTHHRLADEPQRCVHLIERFAANVRLAS